MRIGLDYRAALIGGAGIARYVRNLAGALRRAAPHHDLVLVAPFFGEFRRRIALAESFLPPGAIRAFRRIPGRLVRLLDAGGLLRAETVAGPLDVWHHTDYIRHPRSRGPAVATLFDVSYLVDPAFHGRRNALRLAATSRWLIERARRIIAISAFAREGIARHHGVPEERIDVTPLGVDPVFLASRSDEDRDALRRRLGLRGDYVLHVGTLEPRKNIPRLLRAFRAADRGAPGHVMVLAGAAGWLMEDLPALIRDLDLRGRVLETGRLSDPDLVTLMSGARCLAYPSLHEGFGLPPLEGMAQGVPVLTSRGSAMEETAGDAALLVDATCEEDIARGLLALLRDDTLRADLVARGRGRAATFTWERTAELTLRSYARALAET